MYLYLFIFCAQVLYPLVNYLMDYDAGKNPMPPRVYAKWIAWAWTGLAVTVFMLVGLTAGNNETALINRVFIGGMVTTASGWLAYGVYQLAWLVWRICRRLTNRYPIGNDMPRL